MPNDSGPYDFFVSYATKDNQGGWIDRFLADLLAARQPSPGGPKLTYFLDRRDIEPGADWEHTLNDGIAHSQLFLAFISPHYLASPWCRREWLEWTKRELAQHIFTPGIRPVFLAEVPGLLSATDPREVARKVAEISELKPVPEGFIEETALVVKAVARRQMLRQFTQPFTSAEDLRREDLRLALADLARNLSENSKIIAQAKFSPTTVPSYNMKFTGRVEELRQLEKRLTDDHAGVVCGVQGLGGIGKTELAYTYAHAFASSYPGGRFLIRGEGQATLRDALLQQSDFTAQFQDRINDETRKQPEPYFAALRECLRERIEAKGRVLLVVDNVTDPKLLTHEQTSTLTLLGAKFHLLATTRLAPGAQVQWIQLGRLPEPEALELLEKYRPFATDAERAAAQRVARRLGGFTLAIELAAAWLAARNPGANYARLAEIIGLEDLETIADSDDVELCRHNHQRRLSAVLGPVLEELPPAERRALEYAALLPPDYVPLPWLRPLVVADFPEIGAPGRLSNPWDDLWSNLEKRALFTRAEASADPPRLVRAHRLVQELIRHKLEKTALAARQQAVNQLVRDRDAELEKTTDWVTARWEIEPLEALAWLWTETQSEYASWLLNQVGRRLHHLAEWNKAEPLMRRALAIDEQSYGLNHPDVAIDLNNLAQILKATNRLTEAEPLMRRALAIDEQSLGPNHPNVAIDLNNLAQILKATNRLPDAEPLMRRALAIDEQSLGPNHPNVARDLNNLAQLLQTTNRLAEAEPLMRRALEIDEQSFGPSHPKVAIRLNNLATLLQETNRLADAEPLMRRALEIDEQSLGQNHPDVATDLNNLAQLLQDTNRLTDAEPLMRRALDIFENSLGKDHPNVATQLNNLAQLLQDTNRLADAEPLMRRALDIFENSLGKDHPNVATQLNNLAQLLKATNRLADAEPLMRRALEIDEQSFGLYHPDVARDLNNLAALFQATNRLAKAEPLMRRALDIFENSLGKDHPNVATQFNNLAQLLKVTNRLAEAEPLMRRTLAIDEQSLGPNHPSVARDLNNLAALLQATNRRADAEPLMRRNLEILLQFTRNTGHAHPNLKAAIKNYIALLNAMGRGQEDIKTTLRAMMSAHGLSVDKGDQGQVEAPGPSPRLRVVIARLMQEPEKTAEIATRLQRDDPELFQELLAWIQSQQT